LIPVLKVYEHADLVEKEMAMVKIPLSESISDIEALAHAYNGKIVNVSSDTLIVMVADEPNRVGHFLEAIKRFHPKEIVRSGSVALER
jgi:acetolactate synthase-1/3 small subunit